ncbi:MAG TPA: sigma-70 family RNA polymerase sigma factor [Trueperaceae bacterium]
MDPEAELVARLQRGDEQALADLYGQLGGRVYSLALRMLHSREEAEEVLQDTFLKLYQKADRYREELGSVRAFVYTIARNEALSRLRARSARPRAASDYDVYDDAFALASSRPDDVATRVTLARAMDGLGEQDGRLLTLAFYEGYSHKELSELLDMPLGTVKSRLRRALLALRDRLEEEAP